MLLVNRLIPADNDQHASIRQLVYRRLTRSQESGDGPRLRYQRLQGVQPGAPSREI